jgi:polyisoprenoid-binding protein YceI
MDAPAVCELWRIDPERSSLTFKFRHALLGVICGELHCWGGRVIVDPQDPTHLSVHVWADLSSLDTGSKRRNEAILDTELFDMPCEPALVFDSERVQVTDGGGAVMMGWLGVGSYKKRIAVLVETSLVPESDAGGPRFAAKARAAIDRHKFGLHRQKRPWDWLSEQFVDRQIEVAADVEVTPAARAGALGTSLPPRGALEPFLSRIRSSSHAA